MQDNRMKITEDFTDHSWNEMKTILDREMPEKRKRRFAWLWLGTSLVMMLALLTWYQMKTSSDELKPISSNTIASTDLQTPKFNQEEIVKDNIQIVQATKDVENVDLSPEKLVPFEKSKQSGQKEMKSLKAIENLQVNLNSQTNNSLQEIKQAIDSPRDKEFLLTPINQRLVIKESNVNSDIARAEPKTHSAEAMKTENPEKPLFSNFLSVQRITNQRGLLIQLIERNEIILFPKTEKQSMTQSITKVQSSSKIKLGLFASIHSGDLKTYGGWETGVYAAYQPARRLDFSLNVSYSSHKKYGFNKTIGIQEYSPEETIESSSMDELEDYNSQGNINELIYSVDKIKYLNVELETQMNIFSEFNLLLGAYISRRMSVDNIQYQRPLPSSSLTSLPNFELSSKSELEEKYVLNRYDYGFNIGLSHQYNRMTTFVKFNYGMRNLFSDTSNQVFSSSFYVMRDESFQRDLHRSFELGVKYRMY